MSVTILVDGVKYSGFTSAVINISFLEATGLSTIYATKSNSESISYPIKVQSSVQVLVNDIPVITGFVDRLISKLSSTQEEISITTRDSIADLIDSTISSVQSVQINTPISLQKICELILKKLNINVEVVDKTTSKDFEKNEIIVPQLKQTGFDFLEYYAQRRQAILRASGDGNILLDIGSKNKLNTTLELGKNILRRTLILDYSARYHTYILESQQNSQFYDFSIPESKASALPKLNKLVAVATDSEIRPSRQYCFIPNTTYNKESAQDRVNWEANIRRVKSLSYVCVVQGFAPDNDPGTIWSVNNIVSVVDTTSDINQDMLIDKVEYKLDLDSGSTTTLTLISKDAYSLNAQKNSRVSIGDRDANNLQNPFM